MERNLRNERRDTKERTEIEKKTDRHRRERCRERKGDVAFMSTFFTGP
jgi:hypothetical protein